MRRFLPASRVWAAIFGKLLLREPQLCLLFLALPAIFVLIYWQAFGSGSSGFSRSLSAIVVAPPISAASPDASDTAERLLRALREQRFEGAAALSAHRSEDLDASLAALRSGAASIVIDARAAEGEAPGSTLPCYVDSSSALGPYAESFARAALAAAFPEGQGARIETEYSFTGGSGTRGDFLVSLPGLLVFGWVFGALATALLLAREIARKSLDRAALSGSGAAPIAAGLWAAIALLGLAQSAIAAAAGAAVGYPMPARPWDALVLIVVMDAIMAATSVACGVATAAFASSESAAVNLSMVFIAPLAFLSGAVFELPLPAVASLGGLPLRPNAFLSSTPATEALSEVIVRGSSFASQWPRILLAAATSLVFAVLASRAFELRRFGRPAKGNRI